MVAGVLAPDLTLSPEVVRSCCVLLLVVCVMMERVDMSSVSYAGGKAVPVALPVALPVTLPVAINWPSKTTSSTMLGTAAILSGSRLFNRDVNAKIDTREQKMATLLRWFGRYLLFEVSAFQEGQDPGSITDMKRILESSDDIVPEDNVFAERRIRVTGHVKYVFL